MPVLYVLRDQWLARRQLFAALGYEGVDVLDNVDSPDAEPADPPAADPADRAAQVDEFIRAAGGM